MVYGNPIKLARGPLTEHCKQNNGKDRAFLRDLARAEINLMVARYHHPLTKDCRVCFLSYSKAIEYGVEFFLPYSFFPWTIYLLCVLFATCLSNSCRLFRQSMK